MDFDEFLLKTAKSKLLNPKYIPTLMAVFRKESHGKSIEKCCEEFLKDSNGNVQPRQTTSDYLKEIYKFFWKKYPELPPVSGKGQRKVLTDYFVKLYEMREDMDDKSDSKILGDTEQSGNQCLKIRNYNVLRLSPDHNLCDKIPENDLLGREKEIKRIMELLHPHRNRILGIYGIGGVGKTALAMEVAYRCLEARERRKERLNYSVSENINYEEIPEFEVFIFISAKRQNFIDGIISRNQSFVRTLQEINRDLFAFFRIPFSHEDRQNQLMRINDLLGKQRTLLIIDNLDDLDKVELSSVLDFVNKLPPSTWTILTSRQDIGFSSIILNSLEENDAIDLIDQQVQCKGLDTDILTKKKKQDIFKLTGGIPLAIIYFIHCLLNGEKFNDIETKYQNLIEEEIGRFLFEEEVKKIRKNEFSYNLLLSISLFADSPTRDALIHVADLSKREERIVDHAFEELFKLSFVSNHLRNFGDSSKMCYKVTSLTIAYIRQELKKDENTILDKELTERWIKWHQDYLSKYLDGKSKEERFCAYKEKITPEWKNFCKVLLYCKDHNRYEDIKNLWFNRLNNYTNICGEWNSRISWLKWIQDQAATRLVD
jgi:LuxR family glucitol operon transcriptional activator